MAVLSIMSLKTKVDLKIGNRNMKSFTEDTSDLKTTRKHLNTWKKMSQNQIKKGSIEIKLET